jgi:hypothetical protein
MKCLQNFRLNAANECNRQSIVATATHIDESWKPGCSTIGGMNQRERNEGDIQKKTLAVTEISDKLAIVGNKR